MHPDTNTPTLANFDANDLAGVSPEGLAAFKATLVKQDYSAADVDAKLGNAPPQQGQTNVDVKKVAPAVSLDPSASLSREQRLAGYKNLLRFAMDRDAVFRSAAADGITAQELQPNAAPAPAPMTLDQANAALAANDPPELAAGTSPNDYHIRFDYDAIASLDPAAVANEHHRWTNAFAAAQVPVRLAQPLVTAAMQSNAMLTGLSENELKLTLAVEGQRVRRLGNTAQLVADHELAWSRLPETFRNFANEHKLFTSADAFGQLAHVGQAIREREARRGAKR